MNLDKLEDANFFVNILHENKFIYVLVKNQLIDGIYCD